MSYVLQFNKYTTLAATFNISATTTTLASGVFGSPADKQLLVVDYDNANAEVIECTITGTAITNATRGLDDTSEVNHASGAKIAMMYVPRHYGNGGSPALAWTNYTPTTSTFTLGNGTVTGRYIRIGRIVIYKGSLTIGSTTSGGVFTISLPVTATTEGTSEQGSIRILDNSPGTWYIGICSKASATTLNFFVNNTTQTLAYNYSAPCTWATDDNIVWTITYESAS